MDSTRFRKEEYIRRYHRHMNLKSVGGQEDFLQDLEQIVALYGHGYTTCEISAMYEVEEDWVREIIKKRCHERRLEDERKNKRTSRGKRTD